MRPTPGCAAAALSLALACTPAAPQPSEAPTPAEPPAAAEHADALAQQLTELELRPQLARPWAAAAATADGTYVVIGEGPRAAALFDVAPDGSVRARASLELEANFADAAAAVHVDARGLALVLAERTLGAGPAQLELVRLDPDLRAVERRRGSLPARAYPHGLALSGDRAALALRIATATVELAAFAW